MIRVPPTHKKTLTSGLGVLIICTIIYFVVVHPMKLKTDRMSEEIKNRQTELRRDGFPLQPSKLQDIQRSMLAVKTGTHQHFDRVYDMSMAGFKERIEIYDTVDSFRRSITRFDFQEAYARVNDELSDEQVYLNGEDVTSWPMYKRARDGNMGYLPQQSSVFAKLRN